MTTRGKILIGATVVVLLSYFVVTLFVINGYKKLVTTEKLLIDKQQELIQSQDQVIQKQKVLMQALNDQMMTEPNFTPVNPQENAATCTLITGPRGQVSCQ